MPAPGEHDDWVSVTSTALSAVRYWRDDEGRGILDVTFKDQGRARYLDVPAGVYRALLAAPSHGVFFHAHIRRGGYDWHYF